MRGPSWFQWSPQPFISSQIVNVQGNLTGVSQSSTAWDCWRRSLSLRKRFSVLVPLVGALSGYDDSLHHFFRPLVGISWLCPTSNVFFWLCRIWSLSSNLIIANSSTKSSWLTCFLGPVLEHFVLAAIYHMYMLKYLLFELEIFKHPWMHLLCIHVVLHVVA